MSQFTLARIWSPKMYNWLSRRYDSLSWMFAPGGEEAQQMLVKDIDCGSILDIGCGTGTLLALASSKGLDCYGLDNSTGMLDRAKAKVPSAILIRGNFYDLPYPDNCFDYVVETHALSGVDIDAYRGLMEMLRVCKIGGEIRLADYAVPPVETHRTKLYTRMGAIIGDFPINYSQLITSNGYCPQVEILGSHDMYQYVRAVKDKETVD
jgi:ubiquinone/menaquinone biosynthesis C-methylase UbiE